MYIVTGAAGFIGSAIIWALNKRGIDDIIAVDSLDSDEKWKNLVALKFKDYFESDAFRQMLIKEPSMFSDADAVIHMGACSSTTETDASFLIDNNYNYSKDIADFAAWHNIHLIYASSAATYGDGSKGYVDDEKKIDSLRPLNMYGYSKQLFDLWVRRYNLFDRFAGLKFTNVFGPNEWHKGDMRSLVCKAYSQISDTGKLQLFKSYKPEYADGEQMRDFLYIKDAVDMVMFVMDNKKCGLFNIGSGKAETWNTLANAVFEGMDIKPSIEYIEMPEHLKDKYQYFTQAEMKKLKKAGYKTPATPLKDAVVDYVRNYLIPETYLGI